MNSPTFISTAAQAVFDKKGSNILGLDLRGVSSMTDYVLIAEGTVGRHVNAISQYIIQKLKEENLHPYHVEGDRAGDWVVIDYGDFVIHVFVPDMREKYHLEEMWRNGKIIDLKIKLS